jgi:hypothetical protein
MSVHAFDIFVSYSHEDQTFARDLAGWLRAANLTVWMDEEQLVPGTRFRPALQQGLRESQHLVAIVTASYARRRWTQRELDLFDLLADDENRKIIGVQLDEVDTGPLDQIFLVNQRIDWQAREFNAEAFWLLHCALTSERPGPKRSWLDRGHSLIRDAPLPDPESFVDRAAGSVQGLPKWTTLVYVTRSSPLRVDSRA